MLLLFLEHLLKQFKQPRITRVTSAKRGDSPKLADQRHCHSLPTPKDAGDQANIDLLDVVDSDGTKFVVVHMIDYATRFQLAELLPQKTASHVSPSSRSDGFRCLAAQRSWSQIRAVNLSVTSWLSFCTNHSILLWHCGVGQNGVCERAGGSLRVILGELVNSHQIRGFDELEEGAKQLVPTTMM